MSLFADWHPQDPQYLALHYITMAICILLPWLFLKFETKFTRLIVAVAWLASCLIFSSTYLGFWTYHYNGIQLGFNPYGNPENWKMIVIGFTSIVPIFVDVIKIKNKTKHLGVFGFLPWFVNRLWSWHFTMRFHTSSIPQMEENLMVERVIFLVKSLIHPNQKAGDLHNSSD